MNKKHGWLRVVACALLASSLCGCNNPASTDFQSSTMSTGDAVDAVSKESSRDVELESGMFVYDSDVSISSKDFDSTSAALTDLIKQYGCIVQSDSVSSNDMGDNVTYRTRNVEMRVPAEHLEDMRTALENGDWTIENLSLSGYDMASTYHDWELELDSLQKRYDWYAKQMEETDDADLAREYYDEMSSILEQIDSVKRSMEDAKTDQAWSRVSVYLFEDVSLKDAKRAQGAWSAAGEAMTQLPVRLAYIFGQFVYIVIMLLPYAAIVAAIVLVVRHFSKGSDAKRAAQRELNAKRAAERVKKQQESVMRDTVTDQQDIVADEKAVDMVDESIEDVSIDENDDSD